MLPSTLNQTGFTPSQDGILGNEVGHAQEREHCLPSLSIPKLSGPEDPTRAGWRTGYQADEFTEEGKQLEGKTAFYN